MTYGGTCLPEEGDCRVTDSMQRDSIPKESKLQTITDDEMTQISLDTIRCCLYLSSSIQMKSLNTMSPVALTLFVESVVFLRHISLWYQNLPETPVLFTFPQTSFLFILSLYLYDWES